MVRMHWPFLSLPSSIGPGLGQLRMPFDERTAREEASHWYILLREADGDAAVRAEFSKWLEADPDHSRAWVTLRETLDILDSAPEGWRTNSSRARLKAGPGKRRVADIFAARRWTPGKRLQRTKAVVASGAAACALILAMPVISLHLKADYLTGTGHTEDVQLADGSSLQLAPDSAVVVDYTADGRTVYLLSGRAMFDVTHDARRPFRVKAGAVTTTVLGTSFDIGMTDEDTRVAVARGHVRVEGRAGTVAMIKDLHAGEWVTVDAAGSGEVGEIAPKLVGSWRRGEVVADHRTIASVVDDVRPWFKGRIFVSDTRLAERHVTGLYKMEDPKKALEMIVEPYGGRVRQITPWFLIVSAE